MESIILTSDKGVVLKFKSETTGRKMMLACDNKLGMKYALIGKHDFKDFGTIKEAGDIFRLYQWMEGAEKIT